MQRRRVVRGVLLGSAAALALLLTLLLVLTQSDWGRERLRRFVLSVVDDRIEGEVSIGRIEGDVLDRIRLVDVRVVDEQGRPFVRADTIELRLSLGPLLRRRIELADVRVVNSVVVVDEPPGEDWNFSRILSLDEGPAAPGESSPGWGSWIRFEDVELVNASVTVRTEWEPDGVAPADREEALRVALSSESRENVIRVPGGYQNVMEFRELNAHLPRMLVADPDSSATVFEVASLDGILFPFKPPAAVVRAMSGEFRMMNDSLFMNDVRARLPGSSLSGEGVYSLESGDLVLELDAAPAALADLRWLTPQLPEEGGGSMHIELQTTTLSTRMIVTDADVTIGTSRVEGQVDVTWGDSLRLRDTDLVFQRLDTRLVERIVPDVDLPREGELTGHLRLTGTPRALAVNGDVSFDDAAGGTSRVLAEGQLGVNGQVSFTDLRLRLDPLRADLVRALAPDAPAIGGTIEGPVRLTGVWGDLRVDADVVLRDPATGVSRIAAEGGVEWSDGLRMQGLALRFDPLSAALVRRFAPDVPFQGDVLGTATLTGRWDGRLALDADLELRDPRGGPSHILAEGAIDRSGPLRLVGLEVTMDPLHLDPIRATYPETELPAGATVEGRVVLDGRPDERLTLDGEVAVRDPATGVSRVAGRGGVRLAGGLAFESLSLRLDPLHLSLLPRVGAPEAPVGGTLTGTAVLDGDPQGRLEVEGDLVHEEGGERSHLIGGGVIFAGAEGRVDLDLALQPLSLETVGRFVPDAGLIGSVRGSLRLEGVRRAMSVVADLELPDGAALAARGTVDAASEALGYDLAFSMRGVDLRAVSERAPARTDLTGEVRAEGRGFDPATMVARIDADLVGSSVEGTAADEVRLRASVADGLAVLDSSVVRLETAHALLDGSFGLVEGRSGVLRYDVRVDSLHALAPWIPGADTAIVAPRPAALAAAVEEARSARALVLRDAQVESMATGRPIPLEVLDTMPEPSTGIPKDSIAGRVHAVGTLEGGIARFDVEGTATLEDVVFRGNTVGAGEVAYALTEVRAPGAEATVQAELHRVLAQGFAYDSAFVDGRYSGGRVGEGEVHLSAFQDAYTDVEGDVRFALAEAGQTLFLEDVRIRTDTTTWQNVGVGVVAWGGEGVRVESLELESDHGGRILADGRLPVDGPADLRIVAERVPIDQVEALLQTQLQVSGLVDLDATVTGTRSDPTIVGTALLADGMVGGTRVDRASGAFRYEDLELSGGFELLEGDRSLARGEVRLPIDLSLEGGQGPRLLDAPIFVDIEADSVSLAALDLLSPQIEQAGGTVRGDFSIRGTFDDPVLEGDVEIAAGTMALPSLGITLANLGGRLVLEGDRLEIDSLVATSGGPITLTGGVDLSDLRAPAFDIAVRATDALVLDNDEGRLRVDATLRVEGPLDRVLVTGVVRTRRGEIQIPELSELGSSDIVSLDEPATFERVDTLLQARRDLLLEEHPLLSRIHADLDVTIDRDVWLRSIEANVEIYTPAEVGPLRVLIDGPAREIRLEGTINTDRGTYEFMSRPFQLTRGAVTFRGDPDLNAILQVAAEHEVRLAGRQAFAIRALISGTLREPAISLESSAQPPISQTDLLTYLALGRRAASVLPVHASALSGQGAASGDLVGNMAALATQQLTSAAVGTVINDLEGEAARELGVDVFRITPADLPDEIFAGRFQNLLRGTEIEIGSYVRPRLFASVQTPGTFNRLGGRMEYATPSGFRWTLTRVPRFLPSEPTLTPQDLFPVNVWGFLLRKEWRF